MKNENYIKEIQNYLKAVRKDPPLDERLIIEQTYNTIKIGWILK